VPASSLHNVQPTLSGKMQAVCTGIRMSAVASYDLTFKACFISRTRLRGLGAFSASLAFLAVLRLGTRLYLELQLPQPHQAAAAAAAKGARLLSCRSRRTCAMRN
jgi:hypothetical protein